MGNCPLLSALAAVVPVRVVLACVEVGAGVEDAWAEVGGADDAADEGAGEDVAPSPSGCASVDSCGRALSSLLLFWLLLLLLLFWARTAGATASSSPTRPTEARMAKCGRGWCCGLGVSDPASGDGAAPSRVADRVSGAATMSERADYFAQGGDAVLAGENERQDSERAERTLFAGLLVERMGLQGRPSEDRAPSSLRVWHGLAIGMGAAQRTSDGDERQVVMIRSQKQ